MVHAHLNLYVISYSFSRSEDRRSGDMSIDRERLTTVAFLNSFTLSLPSSLLILLKNK